MSYASFTKSFPNLIKSVPEKLTQPTSIAVMASIGIHVVVGLSLPYLPSFSREKSPSRRTVQLTQLSPQEQSRLPQLSPPPLPPTISTQIQPLGALPPSLSSLPPLPKDSSLYKFPLSSLPLTKPRSTTRQSTNRFSFSPLPSFSPQQSRPRFPIRNSPLWTNRGTSLQTPPRRFAPPSLPGGLPPATLPPVALNPPPLPPVTNFPDITTTPQASLPIIPTAPVFQPTTQTPPLPQQSTSEQPIPQLPQPSSTPTSPTPTTVATGGTTPPLPPSAPSTPTPTGASTPPVPTNQRQEQLISRIVAERAQQQENLRFNPAGTTDEEARKTYVALLNQVNRTETEVSNITGTYPIEACPKKLAGTTTVWAMVGTNGSVTQPQVIKGTGYPVLDQRALEVVNSQRFENKTGSPQPYRVNVSFEYNKEKCPASLAAPPNSTPRTSETSTGTTRPNSTPRTSGTSTGTIRQNSTPRTSETSTGTTRQNSTPRTSETSTGTTRQNSTETSPQDFVENLGRNLTAPPRQDSKKPSRQNSTETPPQESDKTLRQGAEGGED